MKVTTLVLNESGEPHFQGEDQINVEALIEISKARENLVREKGGEWAAGAVAFFGGEVVKAVNTGEYDDVTKAVYELLMSAWLFDSLYCGITATQYLEADIRFTIYPDGAVAHTRVPAR